MTSIAEKFATVTVGKNSGYGARQSREQQQMSDRVHAGIDAADTRKRRTLHAQKKAAEKKGEVFRHDPPPIATCHGTRSIVRSSCGREELLGAMRTLGPTSTAYLLFQYAQDRSSYPQALAGIEIMALKLHGERGWKVRPEDKGLKKEIVRCMCRLALFELTKPKCVKCFGAKCGKNGGICRKCKGTGKFRITDRGRAAALRVNYDAFRKTYARRLAAVKKMIQAMGSEAISVIWENLYGEEQE